MENDPANRRTGLVEPTVAANKELFMAATVGGLGAVLLGGIGFIILQVLNTRQKYAATTSASREFRLITRIRYPLLRVLTGSPDIYTNPVELSIVFLILCPDWHARVKKQDLQTAFHLVKLLILIPE